MKPAAATPYQAYLAANAALGAANDEVRRLEDQLAIAHAHVNAATYNVRRAGTLLDRHDARQRQPPRH